jgi:hypothetical protein
MQNASKLNLDLMMLGMLASDTINAASLAAGVAKRIVVPAGANLVKLAGTGSFYVRWNAALDATVPVADVTDGSGSELNPQSANLRGLASFSIISSAACVVTASFYG